MIPPENSPARSDRLLRRVVRILHGRRIGLAVVALLGIQAGLLADSAMRHSPTMNEPGHLVAGLSHWKFRRFEIYCVNPPLVHYFAALPVMAAGYREDWSGFSDGPAARPEFVMGEKFIQANGERSLWLMTIARWACLPFALAGGLFCFFWSRELWGSDLAGLISLALWCFDPNVLAHGELITSDCAATSIGLGAGWLFWRWLRGPTWRRALVAGVMLGMAELTKTMWIVLFGLWPTLWLLWTWGTRRGVANVRPTTLSDGTLRAESPLASLSQLAVILLLAIYILNLGYGFDGTGRRLGEFEFVSRALTGLEHPGDIGNRFRGSLSGSLPVPLPAAYLRGVDLQKLDFEHYDQPSFLRGEWKRGGWWYYYAYGLAVKTPHGAQVLFVLAIAAILSSRMRSGVVTASLRDLVVLLSPAVAVFVLVSAHQEFNHHVRYVLPVLGFVFVLAGGAAVWFQDQEASGNTPITERTIKRANVATH